MLEDLKIAIEIYKFMQIRTILYQYIRTLIKHVFLLNFTYELSMNFRNMYIIRIYISLASPQGQVHHNSVS